jgi:catechol 2,3-dioxygenase-like lactoylglutathione lyase family enzyme
MPRIRAIEARLAVADVGRSAAFFAAVLGFEIRTQWPAGAPEFAILERDGARVQLARHGSADPGGAVSGTLWIDVEDLATLHAQVKARVPIEWGPAGYFYGRRELGFRDPDGNLVILSEVATGIVGQG